MIIGNGKRSAAYAHSDSVALTCIDEVYYAAPQMVIGRCRYNEGDRFTANSMQWTAAAEAALKEIPFFVRPGARKKIEKYAKEQGHAEITEEVYRQAKQQFGHKQ